MQRVYIHCASLLHLQRCVLLLNAVVVRRSSTRRMTPARSIWTTASTRDYKYVHMYFITHTHTHTHREIRAHPRGWRRFLRAPELRGEGHCAHCFCSPCVVDPHFRPDYLKWRCDPHDANRGKRLRLYRRFWRSLTDLGVWRDPEYLLMKADRAARDDVREVMPLCGNGK